jgi:hypothetical protein
LAPIAHTGKQEHAMRCTASTLLVVASLIMGCQTKGQTGAVGGAGVGALIGQVVGGSTEATLIGAGVGTGLGYIIGNEADKKDAARREQARASELVPFAGTSWQLVSVTPTPERPAKSVVARFDSNGTVTTTRIFDDGSSTTETEKYRAVGDTLIVNKPDYIINAKYRIEGNRLYLSAGERSAVLMRV